MLDEVVGNDRVVWMLVTALLERIMSNVVLSKNATTRYPYTPINKNQLLRRCWTCYSLADICDWW